jgi:hypothetical protein
MSNKYKYGLIGVVVSVVLVIAALYYKDTKEEYDVQAITSEYKDMRITKEDNGDFTIEFKYVLTNNTNKSYSIDSIDGNQYKLITKYTDGVLRAYDSNIKLKDKIFIPTNSKQLVVINFGYTVNEYVKSEKDAENKELILKVKHFLNEKEFGGFEIFDNVTKYKIDLKSVL